ncbi:zinc finger protein 43-like [Anopheles albimanus]|uniref:zinc finger protein 43-like n=1 Tax=Anopheles albimanus TaxID=7167 RepID=UPI00163F1ABF|nr:zinc finger protein 43-like [Anopheles albimanus]
MEAEVQQQQQPQDVYIHQNHPTAAIIDDRQECEVCLTYRVGDILLDIFEPRDDSEKEMPYLVWKHVGLQFTQCARKQFICYDCWKALQEFNRFYMMVQDVHTKRAEELAAIKQEPTEELPEGQQQQQHQHHHLYQQPSSSEPVENGVNGSEYAAQHCASGAPVAMGDCHAPAPPPSSSSLATVGPGEPQNGVKEEFCQPRAGGPGEQPLNNGVMVTGADEMQTAGRAASGAGALEQPEGSGQVQRPGVPGTPSRKRKNQEMDDEILDFYKQLVCDVCVDDRTEYGTMKELNQHMRLAHGEESGRVGCPQCGKQFRTRVKLLEHKQTHDHHRHHHHHHAHPATPTVVGGETDAEKLQSAQMDQEILEFYKRIVCDVCDGAAGAGGTSTTPSTLYGTVRELNHHMRLVHGQQAGTVKCPLCEKKIRTRPKLLEHKRLHQPGTFVTEDDPSGANRAIDFGSTGGGGGGGGGGSGAELSEEQSFDVEIFDFYKPIVCEICDSERLMGSGEGGAGGGGGTVDAEYRTLRQLNQHMRTSHGQESGTIKCKLCSKKFRTRVKLIEHKEMHQNPDRFRCSVCQEVHQNLEEHMQNKHQDWAFSCEECGKRFPFKSRLTAHMGKVHQKKDIICEECNKPFTKLTIEKHKRAVHGTMLMCETCPKTFKTRASLERHMEGHNDQLLQQQQQHHHQQQQQQQQFQPQQQGSTTPAVVAASAGTGTSGAGTVSCTLCNSVLKDEYNLKTHMKRIHAEQTPSTCKTCGKTFKSKHSLYTHISNVCTTRQFPCTVCAKQFKKRTKLKQHMTADHGRSAD